VQSGGKVGMGDETFIYDMLCYNCVMWLCCVRLMVEGSRVRLLVSSLREFMFCREVGLLLRSTLSLRINTKIIGNMN